MDDSPTARENIRSVLQESGFSNLAECGDGQEALKQIEASLAEARLYKIILCDWLMPKMSGYELLEICRRSPDLRELPFIFITTESERKQVFKILVSGATNYIIKPFEPALLIKKVHEMIKIRA